MNTENTKKKEIQRITGNHETGPIHKGKKIKRAIQSSTSCKEFHIHTGLQNTKPKQFRKH